MLGRSAGTLSQADQSLSPNQGTSGTTARDAASSPDYTTNITSEQGQRLRGQVPKLPSQLGQANLGLLGVLPPSQGGNTLEDPSHKWVINLSSKPLTQAQMSLLAMGPNYAITPGIPQTRVHHCQRQCVLN